MRVRLDKQGRSESKTPLSRRRFPPPNSVKSLVEDFDSEAAAFRRRGSLNRIKIYQYSPLEARFVSESIRDCKVLVIFTAQTVNEYQYLVYGSPNISLSCA